MKAVMTSVVLTSAMGLLGLVSAGASAQEASAPGGVTAEWRAVIDARVAKATRVAEQIRATSGGIDDANFLSLKQALLGASEAGLDAAAGSRGYRAAINAMRAADAQAPSDKTARAVTKSLGSSARDFVFFPITPCRLLDTRQGTGTRLVTFIPYGVDLDGGNQGNSAGCTTAGFSAQIGGSQGLERLAPVVNLTVTESLGAGWIVARPVGSSNTSSNQNFSAGQDVANMVVVQSAGTPKEFELMSSVPTHAVVDVLGVFAPPTATALQCATTYNATATTVPVGSLVNIADATVAACPADYTGVAYVWSYQSGIGGISVWENEYGVNLGLSHAPYDTGLTNTNMSLRIGRQCCRVPGR